MYLLHKNWLICLCIIKVAFDIFMDSVNKVVDKSCDNQFIINLKNVIAEIDGVEGIDSLKTRLFGNKIYVDVEIAANQNLLLKATKKATLKWPINILQY